MASSSIIPSGGGSYTTWAAWETAKDGVGGQQEAELSGTGDAGPCTMDDWVNVTSANYPIMESAKASRSASVGRAGAYSNGVDTEAQVFLINVPYTRVEGIQVYANDDQGGSTGVTTNIVKVTADNVRVECNMVVANNSITGAAIYYLVSN